VKIEHSGFSLIYKNGDCYLEKGVAEDLMGLHGLSFKECHCVRLVLSKDIEHKYYTETVVCDVCYLYVEGVYLVREQRCVYASAFELDSLLSRLLDVSELEQIKLEISNILSEVLEHD